MRPIRRFNGRAVFAAAFVAGLAVVGTVVGVAGANIDPDGYQRITALQCPEYQNQPIQFGTDQEGNGVRLRYGWAAKQQTQLDKFLRVQSGTVTLTGPNGFSVTDSWATGNTTGWTPYAQTTGTPPNGKPTPVWETHKWTYFGFLAAGSYSLTVDLRISSAVTDGWNAIGGGSWLKVTNCPVTVNQGP
jgi:hypothetical protein